MNRFSKVRFKANLRIGSFGFIGDELCGEVAFILLTENFLFNVITAIYRYHL